MAVVDVFRGLSQTNLDAFGPADLDDRFIAAFPTFRTFAPATGGTRDELILLRASAARTRALRLLAADDESSLSSWDESNIPQVFRALNTAAHPARRGFPVFTYGRNSSGRFMNVVRLARGFLEIVVPSGTPGFNTPNDVESMCRAAQEWAETNGHRGAIPCFTRAPVPGASPGASLGHVLAVFPRTLSGVVVTSKLPAGLSLAPRWSCRDLPILVGGAHGETGDPWVTLPDDATYLPQEQGLAVVENGGVPVLFYKDDTGLVQVAPGAGPAVSIDPDAAGGQRVPSIEIGSVSVQTVGGQTHIVWGGTQTFHAQRSDTGIPTFSYRQASAAGSPSGVGQFLRAAVSPDTTLHALAYVPRGWSDDAPGQSLLHLAFDGAAWTQLVVDGDGGDGAANGHVAGDCGGEAVAAFEPDGTMHAFYLLRRRFGTSEETFQLRHAELRVDGWHAETLDGAGSSGAPSSPGAGPTTAHVGFSPAAAHFDGALWVIYEDRTYGNLRCARGTRGADRKFTWEFQIVDGSLGRGRTTDTVRTAVAQVWGETLSVVYVDISQQIIRHARRGRAAKNWTYEVIDGLGGVDGRIAGELHAPIAIAARRQADGTSALPLYVVYGVNGRPGSEFRMATLTAL